MADLLTWSIDLGRLSRTRIQVHLSLIAFLAIGLLQASVSNSGALGTTAAALGLLLVALAIHEFGHLLVAGWLGSEPEEVRIWPLGDLPSPSPEATDEPPLTAVGGPIANALMAIACGLGLLAVGARMELNPFSALGGVPTVGGSPAPSYSPTWFVGLFGYVNWVICLANLSIPALPFALGRWIRSVLARGSKDGHIAPYTGRVTAVVFVVVGGFWLWKGWVGGWVWIALAGLMWWYVWKEMQSFEDLGDVQEGGLFGYDFSEGYTSLEASPPLVRRRPESVLRRWRRRRSESRRLRREALEAAESDRLDEILAKIGREGRRTLSDEESRFLARCSSKIRKRRREGLGP